MVVCNECFEKIEILTGVSVEQKSSTPMFDRPCLFCGKPTKDNWVHSCETFEELKEQKKKIKYTNRGGYMTVHKLIFTVSADFDIRFFAILPAINLNFHSRTFEIEFLFFALYVDFIRNARTDENIP